jgi:hypothetical protein
LPVASSCTVTFWQSATGAILSTTVTIEVQVDVFPEASVAVNVTVFGPTLVQLNTLGLTVAVKGPQASAVPSPTTDAPRFPFPKAFKVTVALEQTTTGGVMSNTSTLAVQLELLPLPSVMVKVTVLAPRLAQVKLLGETDAEKVVQLSLEPSPTTDAPKLPFPVAFKVTVAFVHTAVGAILSCTVTTAEQVLTLPLTSVTVSVSGFAPNSAQLKEVWLSTKEAIPQASLLPLFTAEAEVVPFPAEFNCTVTFWQIAFGAWRSFTVIVNVQEVVPQGLVAVMVTVVTPLLKLVPEPVPAPEPVVAPVKV